MKKILPKIAVVVLGLFYILAGSNHFINPCFYLPLIPDYFPSHSLLNYASGVAEVLAGIAVLIPSTRKHGCNAILCVPAWVAWVRLLVIHPLLIYWAYKCRTIK
jgi:uncharacterized membrane protein